MNLIKNIKPYAFVDREFMWVAEYLDGTLFFEFDQNTKQQNDFYQINKNKLLRYGYIGSGCRIYFDTPVGVFYINGNSYSFEYHTDNHVYNLTQQDIFYNNIIQYKNVHVNASFTDTICKNYIDQYNLGYKIIFKQNDIEFYFKPILHIPLNQPAYFTIWLVSDKDLNGRIAIKKNNIKCGEYECLLEAKRGGELTWIVEI